MVRPVDLRASGFLKVPTLALVALLLVPVAHGFWADDAPGRCIRTLTAFGSAESTSLRRTLHHHSELNPPSPGECPARTKIILESNEKDGLGAPLSEPGDLLSCPTQAALPAPAQPPGLSLPVPRLRC